MLLRLVDLDRRRIETRRREKEDLDRNNGKDPDIEIKRASKSLEGVTVKTVMVMTRDIGFGFESYFLFLDL